MRRRTEFTAIALLGAAAIGLLAFRVSHLGGLWRDEVNGVATAMAPSLRDAWRLTEFSSFPFGWTLWLRAWTLAVGSSDAVLRLEGWLGAVALIGAITWAVRRVSGRFPIASLALLAVNPEFLRWAPTVTAWSWGAAAAIVTLVVVLEAVAEPNRRRPVLAALAGVICVQLGYQNAVFVGSIAVAGVLAAGARRAWRRAWTPLAVVVAAAVPLVLSAEFIARRRGWDPLNEVALTWRWILGIASDIARASGPIVLSCWAAMAALAAIAAVRLARQRRLVDEATRVRVNYLAVAAVVALTTLAAFYRVFGYPPEPYYFLGAAAFGLACTEAIIVLILPAERLVRSAVAVLALAAGWTSAQPVLHEHLTNVDGLAKIVATNAVAGDLVVINPWYLGVTFTRYYTSAATVVTVPPLADLTVHRYDLLKLRMQEEAPLDGLIAAIRRTLDGGGRVWSVETTDTLAMGEPGPGAGPGNSSAHEAAWTRRVHTFLSGGGTNTRLESDPAGADVLVFERAALTRVSSLR